jgi:hypothetical protein
MATAILAGVTLAIAAAPSLAHDHQPPRVDLKIGGKVTTGVTLGFHWERPAADPGGCIATDADAVGTYGRSLHIDARPYIGQIRLFKVERPKSLSLRAWAALDPEGYPAGPSTRIPLKLHAVRRSGVIRWWRATFRVTTDADLPLELNAAWRDVEGCGGDEYLGRGFHLAAG